MTSEGSGRQGMMIIYIGRIQMQKSIGGAMGLNWVAFSGKRGRVKTRLFDAKTLSGFR